VRRGALIALGVAAWGIYRAASAVPLIEGYNT
jgi:hypothetical protein